MLAKHGDGRGRGACGPCRRRRGGAPARHVEARQDPAARARRPPARSRLALSRDRAHRRRTVSMTARAPAAGHDRRRWPGLGARGAWSCANDATVKGGTYYPDHGQEAPARPGDRRREPAALHLSGRFRRCQSAEPGRGVPRSRPFRPHLLQSGAHVGARHRADRRGHGLLHRGRGLCAGDERRDDHRARTRARSSLPVHLW
jgi:hypothetical protein